jgi:glycosyltransferase involved in cell wall biosynthesis
MKVAVVTPYYQEPLEKLRRCHESVLAQTWGDCTHIMVADGHAKAEVDGWDVEHIRLPVAHGDNGNTPRSIGGMSALNRGFDAFAYLDADNWFAPDHVESLATLAISTGAPLVFSDRVIVDLDGQPLADDPDDEMRDRVDTSCIFHTKAVAHLIPLWAMMDKPLSPICDRVFMAMIQMRKLHHIWSGRRTLYYESNYGVHYARSNRPPPANPRWVDMEVVKAAYSPERSRQRTGYALNIA